MYNLNNPAYLEARSLARVWEAYAENCSREDITEIGFNDQTGYVYIALEFGIDIISKFGQDVEYLVTDFETGEEFFEETFEDAEATLEDINTRNYA